MKRRDVVLVEDDERMRARLARAIGRSPDLRLTAALGTRAEAMARLATGAPDVLLTDLGLPDGSGIDLIRELRRREAATEVMVITVFGDEGHVLAAIEAGATGYLLKDGDDEYVVGSILELVKGGSPISPAIARLLLRRFREPSPGPREHKPGMPGLTEREGEVLQFLVKGFTMAEIGGLLGISRHTVTSHVRHIYEKLAVRSRAEAVYEAIGLGLVSEVSEPGKHGSRQS